MILCSFKNAEAREKFVSSAGLTVNNDNTVSIPLSLISLARSLGAEITEDNSEVKRYLVKTSLLETPAIPLSIVTDQGNNGSFTANGEEYKLVETTHGLELFDALNGQCDEVSTPVKLMSELTGAEFSTLPPYFEWPRLRMVSRSRPVLQTFNLAQTNFTRKPNLVIVDSGINFDHPEFEDLETEDFVALPVFDNNFRDAAGHGTAVTSFACGKNVGLHRHLKVLNCKIFGNQFKPNALELGQALDAIYQRFVADPTVPMVVNCSWTVAKNSYLESKFQELISAGITIVGAAGNTGIDVSYLTPAGMTDVITVAASDSDDCGAGFNNFSVEDFLIHTNYGDKIDIFAPGVDVVGARYSSGYLKFSGTSASAGFASGASAAILALIPGSSRSDVNKILKDYSNQGVLLLDIDKFTFSQNKLLFLITAENQLAFDKNAYYLGLLTAEDNTILANLDIVVNVKWFKNATGETFTYEPLYDDLDLGDHLTFDSEGSFLITAPAINWNPGEKIRLVSFKVRAVSSSGAISFITPKIFFFISNPEITDNSVFGDVATALENIDNQSFFAAWVKGQVIK